jgi:hypothetical protein
VTHVYDAAKRRAELIAIVQQFRAAIACYDSVMECSKLQNSREINEHARGWQLARLHGTLSALRREAHSLQHELTADDGRAQVVLIEGSTK